MAMCDAGLSPKTRAEQNKLKILPTYIQLLASEREGK